MSAAEHIANATFGCGVVARLLTKGDLTEALNYVDDVRAEIVKAKRCADAPKKTLKPLRVTSAK